jgi:hypothetical protein
MILGRTTALWLALVTATLNVAVSVFSVGFTIDQLAVLNAFAVAVIGVIANEQNPTSAGTFELTTKAPANGGDT